MSVYYADPTNQTYQIYGYGYQGPLNPAPSNYNFLCKQSMTDQDTWVYAGVPLGGGVAH